MNNISGFGLSIRLTASATFPNGTTISAMADDADPLDSPDFTAADTGFGLNGDMVVWNRANGLEVAVNVIPTSDDDINLEVLLDANRTGKDKSGSRDIIGMVINYPDGAKANCSNGTIISGPLVNQVAAAGRYKSRTYRLRFEKVTKSRAPAPASTV